MHTPELTLLLDLGFIVITAAAQFLNWMEVNLPRAGKEEAGATA